MSTKNETAPPDSGGGLSSALDTSTASASLLRTPTNTGLPSASGGGGGPPSATLKMRAAELRQREQLEMRARQREEYAGKFLADRSLPVFDQADVIHILAHANNMGAEPMDYMQQCEEYIGEYIDTTAMVTRSMVEEMVTELMDKLPTPRKTARVIVDAKNSLEKVMEKFTSLTSQLIEHGVDTSENLIEYQNLMQVLYSRVLTVMDAAAIQEKWEAAETNKMKGQVKEVPI